MKRIDQRPRLRRTNKRSGVAEKSSGYSYYANRDMRSEQPKRDTTKDRLSTKPDSLLFNHIITLMLTVVVAAILINLFWLNNEPKINIETNGDTAVLLKSSATYEQAAQKLINGSFLNRNKLTINVSGITKTLQEEFPEISSATMTLSFSGHQTQIYIEPAVPVLLLNTGQGEYVLDSNGVVIGQYDAVTESALSKLALSPVNDINLSVEGGQQALPSGDVSFIRYVVAELKAQNISVASMTLPPGTRELDVVPVGQSYFVKFNLEGNDEEQVGSYLAVKDYLAQNKINPAQYIDVRVPGRTYYK